MIREMENLPRVFSMSPTSLLTVIPIIVVLLHKEVDHEPGEMLTKKCSS